MNAHHHARREHVTVISGAFKVGMGDSFDAGKMNEFAPGSFAYLEPTVHHYAMAKGETVIQLHGTGPWEIVYVTLQTIRDIALSRTKRRSNRSASPNPKRKHIKR
jgi:hypothetical protein